MPRNEEEEEEEEADEASSQSIDSTLDTKCHYELAGCIAPSESIQLPMGMR